MITTAIISIIFIIIIIIAIIIITTTIIIIINIIIIIISIIIIILTFLFCLHQYHRNYVISTFFHFSWKILSWKRLIQNTLICTESDKQYVSVLSVRIHDQINHWIFDKHPSV